MCTDMCVHTFSKNPFFNNGQRQNLARLSVRWRSAWYISSRLSVLKSEASSMSTFLKWFCCIMILQSASSCVRVNPWWTVFFQAKLTDIILIQQAGLLLMNAAAILNEKRFLWSPQTVVSLDFRADIAAMFVMINKKLVHVHPSCTFLSNFDPSVIVPLLTIYIYYQLTMFTILYIIFSHPSLQAKIWSRQRRGRWKPRSQESGLRLVIGRSLRNLKTFMEDI